MEQIEHVGKTDNKVADQNIWKRGDVYIVTSYSTVLGAEILAFPSDGKEITDYLDIVGERRISNTMENHRRIAEAAFRRLDGGSREPFSGDEDGD